MNNKNLTKENIEKYYNDENHSQYECAKYFNISVWQFIKILKDLGIKKDKKKHIDQIKKSKLEKYGNCNYNNREKSKNTCLEKYGVDNPFKDTTKIKQSYVKKFGYEHPMKNKDIANKAKSNHNYKESIHKAHQTYKEKTGYDDPRKNPDVQRKIIETKIKNGVYNEPGISGIERRLEKILCRKFGKENVKNHYRDKRYSRKTGYMFSCDFYIKSEDLFIELNAHPTHNNHPFNSINDSEQVERLLKSDKKWNKNLIETWTIRDVEKLNIANKHKLNYIVLYPTNTINNNKQFNDKKYSQLIEYLLKKLNRKN